MKHIQTLALLLFILASCGSKNKAENQIISAKLDDTETSIKELFSKVSVVPLETVDNSLMSNPTKIYENKDHFFVFDNRIPAVLVFNNNGKFVKKIGKIGKGPGEFTQVYDAMVSEYDNLVYMLSPTGKIYCYNFEGDFVKNITLSIPATFQTIMDYNKDLLALYTVAASPNDDALILCSKKTGEKVSGYWNEKPFLSLNSNFFYKYDDKVYFSTALHHEVYCVEPDTLLLKRKLDFGKDNIDINRYFTDASLSGMDGFLNLRNELVDGTIPYMMTSKYENENYYYSDLVYKTKVHKSFFYCKDDSKSLLFERTTEGLSIKPLSFNEKYITCLIYSEDFASLKDVISTEEYAKLEARSEDDNPCLLKLYFN